MDVSKANKMAMDAPNTTPADTKKSDIQFTTILCSEGEFAAGELANGKFAAVWPGHVDVVDKKEDLVGILNQHENILLNIGVVK